ncbi:HIT family hydrolase [Oceanidesulfovibrio indonesiensis]|uniref:HIT family hydrolase n=1 Tax=Oceanidesulfovibrio indonesiensis TaxID=54767 RepID=A0A7M3MBU6_9BACT|nr:HIT domain-containing protein [Oceanidesulfovibrio indonesiensis]TVM15656.1 HIT family hydrolase [Oceanidesulfovibrio indonesiensis]
MENLWAPWRIDYILGPKPDECVFCLPDHTDEDRERLVLYRGENNFVIMNKFPYNNGHLMVTPYRHVMNLYELTPEESHESIELMSLCSEILTKHFNCEGINIGLNMGEAAGAGIREHLHFHLVPRWNGDSSFMAVFSETRVIPEHLLASYDKLKPYFTQSSRT